MKRAITVFFSFIILAGSSGVTYAQHFCGGKEVSAKITLGKPFLSCKENAKKSSCKDSITKKSCCENNYTQFEIEDNYSNPISQIVFSFPLYIENTFYNYLPIAWLNSSLKNSFNFPNAPPHRKVKHNILYETFLI